MDICCRHNVCKPRYVHIQHHPDDTWIDKKSKSYEFLPAPAMNDDLATINEFSRLSVNFAYITGSFSFKDRANPTLRHPLCQNLGGNNLVQRLTGMKSTFHLFLRFYNVLTFDLTAVFCCISLRLDNFEALRSYPMCHLSELYMFLHI